MTTVLSPFYGLPSPVKEYMRTRAANYDDYDAVDLYEDIPEPIRDDPDAIMTYLQGNEELGIEPREVMHIESEYNGGADTPENLMLGPKSTNRSIGRDDMTPEDIESVEAANAQDVQTILDAEPGTLAQAGESTFELYSASAGSDILATEVAEAAEPTLAETVGEVIVDGLLPTVMAAKAAHVVAKNCTTTEDKIGYGSLAAGTTVLLYSNPVTGPFAWGATGLYSAYKLLKLAHKVTSKADFI